MLRYKEHLSHLSFDEAMALVDELKPKRTYFTHLSHDFGLHETEQAKLPENVFVAYDGLVIDC
jgi:phosphoribosyl 1,2-cyclic phosphate phosphodiesterase